MAGLLSLRRGQNCSTDGDGLGMVNNQLKNGYRSHRCSLYSAIMAFGQCRMIGYTSICRDCPSCTAFVQAKESGGGVEAFAWENYGKRWSTLWDFTKCGAFSRSVNACDAITMSTIAVVASESALQMNGESAPRFPL